MQNFEDRVREFAKLYKSIEGEVLKAESECVSPLHSAWEHSRHAIHDYFCALEEENEDEKFALLGEAEGHLYSTAIYSWQEVAARELALTKELLERRRLKKYALAAEKYELARVKFSAGRKVPRKEWERVSAFFKESISLSREARKEAEPITLRDDAIFWAAIGGFIVAAVTLGLKLLGVF